jgi:hypothetical protein
MLGASRLGATVLLAAVVGCDACAEPRAELTPRSAASASGSPAAEPRIGALAAE